VANIKEVLVVFTWRPTELIVEQGGSQAWTLNPASARKCRYIVCTRNRHHPKALSDFEHGAGFLVGKISAIELCDAEKNTDSPRYLVRISEYALIEPKLNLWPGHRMPFWYVESLATINIDEVELKWIAMPSQATDGKDISGEFAHLAKIPSERVITEAKLYVASNFGVRPDQVEIIVRA